MSSLESNSSSAELPKYSTLDESLPSYCPSLNFYGVALIKTEFNSPYHYNNGPRTWKPVLLHINSTQLNIYNLNLDKKVHDLLVSLYSELNSLNDLASQINADYKKSSQSHSNSSDSVLDDDMFGSDAYGGNYSRKSLVDESPFSKFKTRRQAQKQQKCLSSLGNYYHLFKDNRFLFEPTHLESEYQKFRGYQGELINSYSLAHLQIGEAPSLNHLISAMFKEENIYSDFMNDACLVKYKNVLRLRIEYKQLLFQFWSFHGMIHWFRNLSIGKDLSVPIESRTITKLKSIPSRNSRRMNELIIASAAAVEYGGHADAISESELPLRLFTRPQSISEKDESLYDVSSSNSSDQESTVFENGRRGSNSTSISSVGSSLLNMGNFSSTVTVQNFEFYSRDGFYTTLEKQYISNCIPDLTYCEKWYGKLLTISHFDKFIKDRNIKFGEEIFIRNSALDSLIKSFDKNSNKLESSIGNSKTFLIHQSGLYCIDNHAK
ncbi:uncharacterized protein SPAPADRAFT_153340 [Spathaspora passalidarum NRRL Y-27907]|uniref:Uncharacterized protein n=1 Tax=Spathaspora passalidarum (strain NRRL Y-27907 / 11-Y1) TaxID=619300 RepID=G3AN10_SPAPN|nr:uncharacterized protein SPAPADRAFT_153340 [Spathaspora passalidarum NRRL Y-27907]EGW32424.1 hypothetical protein SPAPADRAFT_153340 [Spathaspora passalidarum NRRL Y-27907]